MPTTLCSKTEQMASLAVAMGVGGVVLSESTGSTSHHPKPNFGMAGLWHQRMRSTLQAFGRHVRMCSNAHASSSKWTPTRCARQQLTPHNTKDKKENNATACEQRHATPHT